MKFLLALLVSLMLTIGWQSSVIADDHGGDKMSESSDSKGKKKAEPDCE